MKLKSIFLFFTIFLSFLSCKTTKIADDLEKKDLALREKIGALFVIRPESLDPNFSAEDVHFSKNKIASTKITKEMKKTFEKYPAGGIILFSKNLQNPNQTKNFTKQIHELKKGILIYIDEEGGKIARLANNNSFNLPKYIDAKTIGETKNPQNAYKMGKTIGKYLKEYGFDVDFAPIADVDTNPKNPIIARRAFSSDPKIASEMVVAFQNGLESEGVLGCLKHFPGHGDTQTDTHKGYAQTTKTWQELLDCEMITFKAGIKNNIKYIMTAHISAPKIDESGVPATISGVLLTEKLRNELNYNGIIITDAMEMGAITKKYNPQEAVIKAIQAGADIILIPYDYIKTFNAVYDAVKKGEIQLRN